jgi:type VI secretion system protein ImpL
MIKLLRRLVTLRTLLVVLIAIAILAAVWFLGPMLNLSGKRPLASPGTRLIVGIIVILLVALPFSVLAIRKARVERKQKASVAGAERLSRAARGADIDVAPDLRESFARGVASVSALTLGLGRAAINGDSLPWYAVIGTPQSGKSALLQNSALNFAIRPDPSPTRPRESCAWWVADDGVLLDVAGGYLAPPDTPDHLPGWMALLSLIKEHRPLRPLHGAILVLSLQELLTLSAESRKAFAANIRARLQEMLSALGARFPIYLVANKADCISGFAESFASLPELDRAMVWGGAFPGEVDFHDPQTVDRINEAFSGLVTAAAEARNDRLRAELDVSRRQRIFGFPEQLRSMLPQLAELAQLIFRNSRFEAKPLLRGIFLTSARQGAQALDVATGRAVAPMKLTAPSVVAAQSGADAFFLQGLFTRFVFPESGLAGFDPQLARKRSNRSLLGILGTVFVVGIAGAALWQSAAVTEQRLAVVNADAQRLIHERRLLTPDASWQRELSVLDLSRKISAEYRLSIGPIPRWIIGQMRRPSYRQAEVSARKVYSATLMDDFLGRIIFDMENGINSSLLTSDSQQLLMTLTAYLMLNDPGHFDADTVRRWVETDWQQNYVLPPDRVQRLDTHLTALLARLPRPMALDPELIAAARQALMQVPTAASVYAELQAQAAADASLPPFQRGVALGADAPLSLAAPGVAGLNTQIPGLYTRQGFETYILRRLPQNAATLAEDNWVLGPSPLAASGSLPNLLDQVAALYSADYIRYWSGAMNGLQLQQAPDLTTAIDALGSLSGPDSPLAKLVSAVTANTNLVQPQQKTLSIAAVASALTPQSDTFHVWPGAAIEAHFAPIIALDRSDASAGTTGNAMDQVRNLIAGAYSLLQGVAAAPNPQFAALNLLKSQSSGTVGNALSPLMTQAAAYPPVIAGLIRQVAVSTTAILADLAGQYISMSWRQTDGNACSSTIAGRYPFNPASSDDVALADFQAFFGPGGIMDSFYTTMIAPLGLAPGGSAGGTAALLVDPDALASFEQARRIRDAFFRNGQLGLPFGITPRRLDPRALNDVLTIGDQPLTYQHEPPRRWDLSWPFTNGDPGISLTVTDLKHNAYTLSFAGDWALFRFLAAGAPHISAIDDSYAVSFSLSGLAASYELSTNSLHSAFDPTIVSGFTCPQFN